MQVEDFGVRPGVQHRDRRGTLWRLAIILFGVGIVAYNALMFSFDGAFMLPLVFLGAMLFISEYFGMPLILGGTVSVSGGVLTAALFLLPTPQVVVMTALGVLAAVGMREARAEQADVFLSLARKVAVIFAAGAVYHLSGGPALLAEPVGAQGWLGEYSLQIGAALITYFLVDYLFDQLLVTLKQRTPLRPAVKGAISYQGLGWVYFGSLPPGILAAFIFKVEAVPFNMVWTGLFFLLFLGLLQYASFLNLRTTASYPRMLNSVMTAIESQDPLCRGHSERVGQLATATARQMGLYGEKLNLISYAALLHDIGKIYLDKDNGEEAVARLPDQTAAHAVYGAQILRMDPYLRQVADVVRKHHEPYRYKRRSQDDVPIGARIINVAAAYDELTHLGPLGNRVTTKKALAVLKKDDGAVYDPKVVRAFEKVLQNRDFLF